MNHHKNQIAMRSKDWIVESLLSLMKTNSFSEITISEIAANADLDRRTFYRHFKKKEDIISYYLEKSGEEYEIALQSNVAFDNSAIVGAFFAVCYNQRDILLLLNQQNLSHFVLLEFHTIFFKYQSKYASPEELQHPKREYLLAYHIGGLWNIMMKWLSDGHRETPQEMAQTVVDLIHSEQI